jgi:hypothetical protein
MRAECVVHRGGLTNASGRARQVLCIDYIMLQNRIDNVLSYLENVLEDSLHVGQ